VGEGGRGWKKGEGEGGGEEEEEEEEEEEDEEREDVRDPGRGSLATNTAGWDWEQGDEGAVREVVRATSC